MLNALLLLAAATLTGQDRVEKIPIKHVDPVTVYKVFVGPSGLTSQTPAGIKRVTYDPTDNSLIVQGSPEAIEQFKELVKLYDKPAQSKSIPLRRTSAQTVYEMLTGTGQLWSGNTPPDWIPAGVKVAVDPSTNSIVATGPMNGVLDVELLIAQFDKAASPVIVEFDAFAPMMDRRFSTSGRVENNSSLTYTSDGTKTSVRITPRLNNDKTITLFFSGGLLGTEAKLVARVKSGETIIGRIAPGFQADPAGDRPVPTIEVSYSVGVAPPDYIHGGPVPRDLYTQSKIVGTAMPALAELRFVIKVTLPDK